MEHEHPAAGSSGTAESGASEAETPRGEPVVGRRTGLFAVAGLLAGVAVGLLLGVPFGRGRLNIAGLAPLAAGGVGVSSFVFASFFASLLGLAGALYGTWVETRGAGGRGGGRRRHGGHGGMSFVNRLPLYGSVLLALFMAYTLYEIASRGLGSGEPSDQSNRVHWNQKNASRVGGAADGETAAYVLQTVFTGAGRGGRPGALVTVGDDWRAALAATPLIAAPTNAAVVITGPAGADAHTASEVERLSRPRAPSPSPSASPPGPPGIGATTETPAATSPVATASTSPPQSDASLTRLTIGGSPAPGVDAIPDDDPAAAAAAVDERLAAAAGGPPSNVIVVASDAEPAWALPAGAYAARTGTPVLFVTKNGLPPATAAALGRRARRANVYVLGPEGVVPSGVLDQLRQFGAVTRIEGGDPYTNAVRFAEFRDDGADFGWGHTGRGPRQASAVNSILVNPARWQDGVMAAHLARRGKAGPILLTGKDALPAVVDNHLWRQRPAFANTPAEGPFNHVWVVGSFDRIDYGAQAWADYSQEIEQYMTLGDSALSGYEALGFGWLAVSIACAAWILFHSVRRMDGVMPTMKAAWAVFALLLGPLALWLYVASYHRRERTEHEGMTMWQRPLWLQTVSATVMMFAFDMMLMALAVFFLTYIFGFPVIRFDGPLYWLGTSMFLMMVFMYLFALAVMTLVFHTPMTMHERKIKSYGKALLVGLPMMVATMTVESAGMMPTMWWQQMIFLPAMQMPTADDLTMWTTLLFSVFVGFLVVLPFNYWLVVRGRKAGTM